MTAIKSARLKQRESAQRFAHRTTARQLVMQRFEQHGGRCEGCSQRVDVYEVAHLFGRGRKAGIPDRFASTPELMAALCCARTWGDRLGCHERADRGLAPELLDTLRWKALQKFALRWGVSPVGNDAMEVCQRMIREVEARA